MSAPTSLEKFSGSKVEIDSAGDYSVNTTDATNGDVRFQLAEGRALVVEIAGTSVFEISQNAGQLHIDIGGAASERLVLGDALKTFLNDFFTKYNTHIHGTSAPGAPTTPPIPPPAAPMTDALLSSVARTKG